MATTKLLRVLTSLVFRLPSPGKISGNKSKGKKTVLKPYTYTEARVVGQ